MAWLPITNYPFWEYSDQPNIDKKQQDTYDYDKFTHHVNGIISDNHGIRYVLARQTKVPSAGYGELCNNKISIVLSINNIYLTVDNEPLFIK